MLATILLSMLCLSPAVPNAPVQVYSVRQDGAGHACDCTLAPCGPFVEPGCMISSPDACGNVGPCAYLDIHAYPAAMVWRGGWTTDAAGCFDTDGQEVRLGWSVWWRLAP